MKRNNSNKELLQSSDTRKVASASANPALGKAMNIQGFFSTNVYIIRIISTYLRLSIKAFSTD